MMETKKSTSKLRKGKIHDKQLQCLHIQGASQRHPNPKLTVSDEKYTYARFKNLLKLNWTIICMAPKAKTQYLKMMFKKTQIWRRSYN